MELRLTCRHWGYALTLVLFGIAMVTLFSSPDTPRYETAQSLLMIGVGRNATGLISLILLFMTAVSAARSQRTHFAALEMAFPTGTEITFGRMLALLVAGLPFLLTPLSIALAAGPIESFVRGSAVFVGESVLTIAVSVVLVWGLQITFGIRRWMLPLLGLVWLGAAVGTVILNYDGLIVPGISLFNFPRFGYGSYTDTWGRSFQGNLPLYLNGFYLGSIILMVSGIASWVYHQRFFKPSMPLRLGAAAGLTLTLMAGGVYTMTVAQGNADWQAQRDVRASLPAPLSPAAAPYTITRYDITLDLGLSPHFAVEIDVQNRGSQPLERIDFTLNAQLEIQESSLSYERHGDFVTLTLNEPLASQATKEVRLVYTGTVVWLDTVFGAPVETTAFIRADGIHLPPSVGWYPVAGRVSLLTGLTGRLPDQPAAMRLHVSHNESLSLASNLPKIGDTTFASGGARWLMLIGAPDLETERIAAGVLLIGSRLEVAKVRDDLSTLMTQARQAVQPYLSPPDLTLMLPYTHNFIRTTRDETPPTAEGAAVFVRSQSLQFNAHRYESSVYAITHAAFGDTGSSLLTDNVAYFFWLRMQTQGDINAMRNRLAERQSSLAIMGDTEVIFTWVFPANSPSYDITAALLEVDAEQGTEATARVIQSLQSEFNTLKDELPARVVRWIQQEVADEP
jgi:hypothetical protein